MEQQLNQLFFEVRQMPSSLQEGVLADGLRRLLPKANSAAEMRVLFNVISEDQLLKKYPRLLLALADHGPLAARDDPDLIEDITNCCLFFARSEHEPRAVWEAVTECVDKLPEASVRAMAQGMQPHLKDMPITCQQAYFRISRALARQNLCIQMPQQAAPQKRPSDNDTPLHTALDDGEDEGSLSEHDTPTAAPRNTVTQSLEKQIQNIRIMATQHGHLALAQLAEGLSALLDDDQVNTEAQWNILLSQVDLALLQASPNLRKTLAAKFLSSPGISPSQVAAVVALCVRGDPSGHHTQGIWAFFSHQLQSGTLPPERAQKLLESLNAAQHLCPEPEKGEFRKAQNSVAQQLQGLDT